MHSGGILKYLIWLPLLCSLALGQGATVLPKTTILPKTTVFPGTAGGGGSAPTFVQDASNVTGTGICTGGALTACAAGAITTTTNNALAVAVYTDGSTSAVTVADTCGTSGGASNTYTALSAVSGQSTGNMFTFVTLVGFGKSCIVTGTRTNPSNNMIVYVQEITGVNLTTQVAANNFAAARQVLPGTTLSSGNLAATTAQANTYLFGVVVDCFGVADVFTQGAGFTLHGHASDGGNCDFAGESQALVSSGVNTPATFTSTQSANGLYMTAAIAIQHP